MPQDAPASDRILKLAASFQFGAMLQVLASLLWLGQAALVALAVQGMATGGELHILFIAAGAVFLLGFARAECEARGSRRVFSNARAQLSELRKELAASLAFRSPLDPGRPASGLAASALAEQAEALVPYLTRYQPARWRVNVVPLVIFAAVFFFSWAAALVLALTAPLIPLFMAIVGLRAKAASDAQMLELGGMNAFLLDRLRGLSTLRALGAVDATALRLRESARALGHKTMAVLRIAFLSSAVLELFSALGVAMVAVYVGFHLLGQLGFGSWGARLTLGQGLFILLLAPAFYEPLRELSAVWHDRAAGEAALDAISQMTRGGVPLPGTSADAVGPQQRAAEPPSVTLHDLVFAHPGEAACIDLRSLQVCSGEHVALLGSSGSGKSTLLALIAGLVSPRSGCIDIGGEVLTDRSAGRLRARMAWMGQKPHIFAGSVQHNVSLGRPDVRLGEVQEAVRFAALESVIQAYPAAALGEGGAGLSGGEGVRLALARLAVNAQADLLLVDEPTAHLDGETALRVADALLALADGRTLIVATHDPILAARMGRVIRVGPPFLAQLEE